MNDNVRDTAARIVRKAYGESGGPVDSPPTPETGAEHAPMMDEAPSRMADETDDIGALELFIDNDSDLYRQMYTPILVNLMRKRRRGNYDSGLAIKAFYNLATEGAKKYFREHGGRGRWYNMFPTSVRRATAVSLRNRFEMEADLGNYDGMLERADAARRRPVR